MRELVAVLRRAHAGELAAVLAYEGHWRSLRDPREIQEIRTIGLEEAAHRRSLRRMLAEVRARPGPLREGLFWIVGTVIAAFCRVGGWFLPMYGAGRLERGNIVEYEEAARLAFLAGVPAFVEPLLCMAEVEWEHERYFRQKTLGVRDRLFPRVFLHLCPIWLAPEPKETIRERFSAAARRELPPSSERALSLERASAGIPRELAPRTGPRSPARRARS